jgi:hypothetical protein
MDLISLILSADNIRTLILLIAAGWGFTWFKAYIDKRFYESNKIFYDFQKSTEENFNDIKRHFKAIDDKFVALKENDFAHLHRTIKALTFTLEKNKYLNPEDKKYVDSHLDEK